MTQEQEDIMNELYVLMRHKYDYEHKVTDLPTTKRDLIEHNVMMHEPTIEYVRRIVLRTRLVRLRQDIKSWRRFAKETGYYDNQNTL